MFSLRLCCVLFSCMDKPPRTRHLFCVHILRWIITFTSPLCIFPLLPSLHRFAEDERMKEACRLLRSSKTLFLKVERSPEATDVSHRDKQQQRLLSLCRRSLAFSVGRGMLTLSSLDPLMAEHLPIPPLALSGQVLSLMCLHCFLSACLSACLFVCLPSLLYSILA